MAVRRITGPLNTTRLAEAVAAELGASDEEGHAAVMAVFNVITRATASGHKVVVTNFGTWLPYRAKARSARNPQTGEAFAVPAHQAVKFRFSDRLLEAVRRRDRKATVRKLPKGPGKTGKTGA